jgi:type IV pilus assembly protein PilM
MNLTSKLPNLSFGRGGGGDVVGLDIQPGFVAAVRSHVNGSILAEQVATMPLPADTVRDGEVTDQETLGEALRELFGKSGLSKRVRVGIANQRTVLRTLELPPITDHKELAAAVGFQAQEQIPMPLSNAVLDFHALGIIETPAGPRQRVVLVAAQRDMVERLLGALRLGGLDAQGVDLSAFALIRSLYRKDADDTARVLYLNVDGLTNLAIADGPICRFTRVLGSGLEGMSGELAERRGVAIAEARAELASVDLNALLLHEQAAPSPQAGEPVEESAEAPSDDESVEQDADAPAAEEELPEDASSVASEAVDEDLKAVLEGGIREISGEVRNSLDFHRSQDGGGDVAHIVLSGAAQGIPGFTDALEKALGVEVRSERIGLVDERLAEDVSPDRLAIAAGLSTLEAPQ